MDKKRKSPTKILEFVFGLGIGGMERGVVKSVLGLDRSKFTPIVCCLGKRMVQADILERNGVKVYFFNRDENSRNYLLIFKLAFLLIKEGVRLIHTHNRCGYLYGVPAAIIANTPVVVHSEHGCSLPESKSLMFIRWALSWKINKIVTRSQLLAKEIIRYWRINPNKLQPIASGIDASGFEREFDKNAIRQKFGVSKEEYLVGIVARFDPIKDHQTLIRAMAIVSKDIPHAKLVLVGDGSLRQSLQDLTVELGIKENVIFLGEQEDIAPILAMLDLFVLTSRKEGTSTAIMEAMATELPIIATRVGGTPELISDGENGILVPARDPESLSKAIIEIATNKDRAKVIARNARSTFEKKYRIKRMNKEYQQLFIASINSKQPIDLYRPIAKNIIIPIWAFKEKTPYLKFLKYLEQSQFYSLERLKQIQFEKLQKLLSHAYENCPYYYDLFNKSGFSLTGIRSLNDIGKIPLLTKNDIRTHKSRMIATNISKKKLIPKKTSGSSGVPLELFIDFNCNEWRRAVTIRNDQWSGWRLSEGKALIWGNPPYKQNKRIYLRNFLLERCFYLDALNINEAAIMQFLSKIKKLNPTLLLGHAHSLYLFAQFLEKNLLIGEISFKGIISAAMILHDWQRKKLEQILNCKVFNRYGCEEVSLIASECQSHEGLHINMDSLLVEFIKDGRPALPGEEASVVITDLMNYGMPFIRYKVGDIAVLSDKQCTCGRHMPLIEKVIGRDADYIITPEHKLISGISLTDHFVFKIPGLAQLQIIQDRINHLTFKIVKDNTFNIESKKIINDTVIKFFGNNMTFDINFVKDIPQEKSGKYRFVISRVKADEIS